MMRDAVDTKDLHAVEQVALGVYRGLFAERNEAFIPLAFDWVNASFNGKLPGYLAIDARYHDFEHTLQGTLCFVRLLQGRGRADVEPVLTREMFELGLLAILFHDTGYLKKREDRSGTGAKYTLVHVQRSMEFAAEFLGCKGYTPEQVSAVQNMIRCTGVGTDLAEIPFKSAIERCVGYALGTADLLGQMAAKDYIDKLPILYDEFKEAAGSCEHPNPLIDFSSPRELMGSTESFWLEYVLPKIKNDFGGIYGFLEDGEGRNPYLERVQTNLDRLKRDNAVS